jgi:hypothetical protein
MDKKGKIVLALLVSSIVGLLAGTFTMHIMGLPTFFGDLKLWQDLEVRVMPVLRVQT